MAVEGSCLKFPQKTAGGDNRRNSSMGFKGLKKRRHRIGGGEQRKQKGASLGLQTKVL